MVLDKMRSTASSATTKSNGPNRLVRWPHPIRPIGEQEAGQMDKLLKVVQLLTLILVSLVCVTYIWRQYYDYEKRKEAWDICWKWTYDEGKNLQKSEALAIQECMQRIKP
jgi:hypothetical protein